MGFLDSKIKEVDNGRQVLDMKDSVNFLLITKDDYVVLGGQYRAGGDSFSLNCFGGYLDDGEDYSDALYRECMEETNVGREHIDNVEYLYKSKFVSIGYTTERNTLAIIHLNKDKDDIEFKCNDADENISISFKKKDDLWSVLNVADGLKLYLGLKHIMFNVNNRVTALYELVDDIEIAIHKINDEISEICADVTKLAKITELNAKKEELTEQMDNTIYTIFLTLKPKYVRQ